MDQAAEEYEFEVGSVVPDLHQHDLTSSTLFDFIDHPDLEKDIAPVDEILLFVQYFLNSLITSASKKNILEGNNKQTFSLLIPFPPPKGPQILKSCLFYVLQPLIIHMIICFCGRSMSLFF